MNQLSNSDAANGFVNRLLTHHHSLTTTNRNEKERSSPRLFISSPSASLSPVLLRHLQISDAAPERPLRRPFRGYHRLKNMRGSGEYLDADVVRERKSKLWKSFASRKRQETVSSRKNQCLETIRE